MVYFSFFGCFFCVCVRVCVFLVFAVCLLRRRACIVSCQDWWMELQGAAQGFMGLCIRHTRDGKEWNRPILRSRALGTRREEEADVRPCCRRDTRTYRGVESSGVAWSDMGADRWALGLGNTQGDTWVVNF